MVLKLFLAYLIVVKIIVLLFIINVWQLCHHCSDMKKKEYLLLVQIQHYRLR